MGKKVIGAPKPGKELFNLMHTPLDVASLSDAELEAVIEHERHEAKLAKYRNSVAYQTQKVIQLIDSTNRWLEKTKIAK